MGFYRGPNLVTDGLVLNLDAGNTKSYPGSGTVWRDLSGNNNSGSLVNGPTFSSTNYGSIVFDGVDDYVNLGNSTSITTFSQLTVNAWVNPYSFPAAFNQGRVIIRGNDSYILYWYANSSNASDNKLYFYSPDIEPNLASAVGYLTSNFTTNTIYNICGTYNGSSTNLYINGSVVATSTGKSGVITGSLNISIGSTSAGDGYYLQGAVHNIQLYNRALSASEIQQNYNAQKSRFNL